LILYSLFKIQKFRLFYGNSWNSIKHLYLDLKGSWKQLIWGQNKETVRLYASRIRVIRGALFIGNCQQVQTIVVLHEKKHLRKRHLFNDILMAVLAKSKENQGNSAITIFWFEMDTFIFMNSGIMYWKGQEYTILFLCISPYMGLTGNRYTGTMFTFIK